MSQYNFFGKYTQLFYKLFLEQVNLEGQWEVAISEISYPSIYQNVTEGKFMVFDTKLSKSSKFCYLEPGLHPPIADIVEAINTLHTNSRKTITPKAVSQLKCL